MHIYHFASSRKLLTLSLAKYILLRPDERKPSRNEDAFPSSSELSLPRNSRNHREGRICRFRRRCHFMTGESGGKTRRKRQKERRSLVVREGGSFRPLSLSPFFLLGPKRGERVRSEANQLTWLGEGSSGWTNRKNSFKREKEKGIQRSRRGEKVRRTRVRD